MNPSYFVCLCLQTLCLAYAQFLIENMQWKLSIIYTHVEAFENKCERKREGGERAEKLSDRLKS